MLPRYARKIEVDGVVYQWIVSRHPNRMALTVQAIGEGEKLWREEIDGNQPFPQWFDPTGEKETLRKDAVAPDTMEELLEWAQLLEEKYGWTALSRRLEQDWIIGPGDVARYIRSKKV